ADALQRGGTELEFALSYVHGGQAWPPCWPPLCRINHFASAYVYLNGPGGRRGFQPPGIRPAAFALDGGFQPAGVLVTVTRQPHLPHILPTHGGAGKPAPFVLSARPGLDPQRPISSCMAPMTAAPCSARRRRHA